MDYNKHNLWYYIYSNIETNKKNYIRVKIKNFRKKFSKILKKIF